MEKKGGGERETLRIDEDMEFNEGKLRRKAKKKFPWQGAFRSEKRVSEKRQKTQKQTTYYVR